MVGDILQPTHLIFVLVVALLVLGPKKLPEVGRQLGNGLRDFRAAINGEHAEPEQVKAPYEEPVADAAPPATASETVPEHAFAHTSAPAAAEGHGLSHEATMASDDGGVRFDDEKPASGHEFAYETSESADKRTDALG
jgi:sec-independent protein translocase protein TatA